MEKMNVGDVAPCFEAQLQDGRTISLNDFQDKKLILYFYPKDNTPGCTAEACSLRDGYSLLKKEGFTVVGVSPDPQTKHVGFIKKHELPFDLIADTDNKVATAYGVWGMKKFLGRSYMGILRTTFVIENGIITRIFEKVDTKDHYNQILNTYK